MYTNSHMARERIKRQNDEIARSIAEYDIRVEQYEEERRRKMKKEDPVAYEALLKKEASDREFKRIEEERNSKIDTRLSIIGIVVIVGVIIFAICMLSQPY